MDLDVREEVEARQQAFADRAPAVMFVKDREGRYRFVNHECLKRVGLRREQVLGHSDAELFPAALALAYAANEARLPTRGEPSEQALSRRLVEAEEAERRRIARELHDRVGQNLSALNINLDIVLGALGESGPQDLRVRLRDSLALVDATLQTIENVMAELRPPLLEEYGLGAALGWHAEDFMRHTGIRVEFEDGARERIRALRRESAVALFRIAQEAFSNVAKHAQASGVRMQLEADEERLSLAIRDDGRGFDAAAMPAGRYGMKSMRERAEAVGGDFFVESAPGRGAMVRASVPFA